MSQGPLEVRPLPSGDSTPKLHLPSPLTPLLGRERELADVQRLLSTARLVTLTGPDWVLIPRIDERRLSGDLALRGDFR